VRPISWMGGGLGGIREGVVTRTCGARSVCRDFYMYIRCQPTACLYGSKTSVLFHVHSTIDVAYFGLHDIDEPLVVDPFHILYRRYHIDTHTAITCAERVWEQTVRMAKRR
jgi:hypothetical protein